jgi:hypothetical protein
MFLVVGQLHMTLWHLIRLLYVPSYTHNMAAVTLSMRATLHDLLDGTTEGPGIGKKIYTRLGVQKTVIMITDV